MSRKKYPKLLDKLLKGKTYMNNVKLSQEVKDLIDEYQQKHQEVMGGHKLTITDIASYLIEYGKDQLKKDIKRFDHVISLKQ